MSIPFLFSPKSEKRFLALFRHTQSQVGPKLLWGMMASGPDIEAFAIWMASLISAQNVSPAMLGFVAKTE